MVAATKAATKTPKITIPPLKMASLKDARAVVEEGGCAIWGQLPDIPYKSNKFGLDFTLEAQRVVRRTRTGGPPLRISNHCINVVRIAMTIVTWKNGFFQLSVEDSTTGKPKNLSLLLLSKINYL